MMRRWIPIMGLTAFGQLPGDMPALILLVGGRNISRSLKLSIVCGKNLLHIVKTMNRP